MYDFDKKQELIDKLQRYASYLESLLQTVGPTPFELCGSLTEEQYEKINHELTELYEVLVDEMGTNHPFTRLVLGWMLKIDILTLTHDEEEP